MHFTAETCVRDQEWYHSFGAGDISPGESRTDNKHLAPSVLQVWLLHTLPDQTSPCSSLRGATLKSQVFTQIYPT